MSPCSPPDKDIHRLVFTAVSHAHAGVYKSVIANKVGKATCYAHLYVTGKDTTATLPGCAPRLSRGPTGIRAQGSCDLKRSLIHPKSGASSAVLILCGQDPSLDHQVLHEACWQAEPPPGNEKELLASSIPSARISPSMRQMP